MIRSFAKFFSLFSIDVAIGAVSSAIFVGMATRAEIPGWLYLCTLFFAVTGIYSFDHLFDLSRANAENLSVRRLEHQQKKTALKYVSLLSLLMAGILSLFLPSNIRLTGLVIGFFMLIYFGLLYRFNANAYKDLSVSLGYAAGIWIPLMEHAQRLHDFFLWTWFLLFILNTLQIMMFYAQIDSEADHREALESMVKSPSWFKKVNVTLNILFVLSLFKAIYFSWSQKFVFISILAAHFLMIHLLKRFSFHKLNPQTVRYLGEYSYLIYLSAIFAL